MRCCVSSNNACDLVHDERYKGPRGQNDTLVENGHAQRGALSKNNARVK